MVNFIQNGISFQLNAEAVTPFGGKYISSTNYDSSTKLYNNKSAKLSNAGVSMSINCVEIDWNSAALPNGHSLNGGEKIINNTGDLLKLINNIQQEIYILTDIIFEFINNNYYWYVGTTMPSNPLSENENTGNNKWTSLGSSLPTSSIEVTKLDETYAFSTWYIAAPAAADFTLYNATNAASDEATWDKSSIDINGVNYTLWTARIQSFQAVEYLHK